MGMVVGAYLDEQINLGKAAELLGMQTLEEARAEAWGTGMQNGRR